jgi:ferredoxin
MDDDDIAVVKVEIVPPDKEDDCQEAADSCPVGAIEIQK